MKAIMVCVDYADLLEITLPRNLHHFTDGVLVVTSRSDEATARVCLSAGVDCLKTDVFWRGGARFNKWAGMEEGLSYLSKGGVTGHGWLCIMDADVVWPRKLPRGWMDGCGVGCLFTPYRRMMETVNLADVDNEEAWDKYPRHRQEKEFAGYSQIFHTSDPVLGPLPWHELDWTHAGGADSFFQRKWPESRKIRPDWACLHLGPAGVNWAGRTSTRMDGTTPAGAKETREALRDLLSRRRVAAEGTDPFRAERIRPAG